MLAQTNGMHLVVVQGNGIDARMAAQLNRW
jgi:hypothetical protein